MSPAGPHPLSAHPHHGGEGDAAPTGSSTVAGASIVGALGFLLIALSLEGKLTNYLQPVFIPFMIATGLALVGLCLWTFIGLHRDFARTAADQPMRRTSWLMLVPLALVMFCAPNPLGTSMLNSNAVGGGGSASAAVSRQGESMAANRIGRNPDGTIAYPVLAADQTNELTIEDLSNRYGFGRKSDLDGKEVKIIGFAGGGNNHASASGKQGSWRLSRFKIYCCAADAVAYTTNIKGRLAEPPEKDSWFEVTGKVDVPASGDLPVVTATEVKPIHQPEVPYL